MKISTKSWHYKMNSYILGLVNLEPSNSLCLYFWQTVLLPFVAVAVAVLAAIAAVVVVQALGFFFFYAVGGLLSKFLVYLNILPETFALIKDVFNWRFIMVSVIFELSIAALWYGKIKYKQYRENKDEENYRNNIEPKPVLLFEYIKAKKRKICPLIKFTDE